MDITELERETAELLPDRQALCCWNWHPVSHHCGWWGQQRGWGSSGQHSWGWDSDCDYGQSGWGS